MLDKKYTQYSSQVERFRTSEENRMTSGQTEERMKEIEKVYFVLLDKFDLGLGDTITKMKKEIAKREKDRDAAMEGVNKLARQLVELEKAKNLKARKPLKEKKEKLELVVLRLNDEIDILQKRLTEYENEKQELVRGRNEGEITQKKYETAEAARQADPEAERVTIRRNGVLCPDQAGANRNLKRRQRSLLAALQDRSPTRVCGTGPRSRLFHLIPARGFLDAHSLSPLPERRRDRREPHGSGHEMPELRQSAVFAGGHGHLSYDGGPAAGPFHASGARRPGALRQRLDGMGQTMTPASLRVTTGSCIIRVSTCPGTTS